MGDRQQHTVRSAEVFPPTGSTGDAGGTGLFVHHGAIGGSPTSHRYSSTGGLRVHYSPCVGPACCLECRGGPRGATGANEVAQSTSFRSPMHPTVARSDASSTECSQFTIPNHPLDVRSNESTASAFSATATSEGHSTPATKTRTSKTRRGASNSNPRSAPSSRGRHRRETPPRDAGALGGVARRDARTAGVVLLAAAWAGKTLVVLEQLDGGANVNVQNPDGLTPLHNAVIASRGETVTFLLNRGANIDAGDVAGRTPLHHAAAHYRSGRMVTQLLAAGADVNRTSHGGSTPLHVAVAGGNVEAATALLQYGANAGQMDDKGKTPRMLTTQQDMIDLLRTYD